MARRQVPHKRVIKVNIGVSQGGWITRGDIKNNLVNTQHDDVSSDMTIK